MAAKHGVHFSPVDNADQLSLRYNKNIRCFVVVVFLFLGGWRLTQIDTPKC